MNGSTLPAGATISFFAQYVPSGDLLPSDSVLFISFACFFVQWHGPFPVSQATPTKP